MVIRKRLNNERGIIVSDAILAILIILLFVGIITSLIINIVFESTKIKMDSQHTYIATEILEYIEKAPYDEITEDKLVEYINSMNEDYISATALNTEDLSTLYKIQVDVNKYNETEDNTDKLDLIKIVNLTIKNELDGKVHQAQFSKLKKATLKEVKEILE